MLQAATNLFAASNESKMNFLSFTTIRNFLLILLIISPPCSYNYIYNKIRSLLAETSCEKTGDFTSCYRRRAAFHPLRYSLKKNISSFFSYNYIYSRTLESKKIKLDLLHIWTLPVKKKSNFVCKRRGFPLSSLFLLFKKLKFFKEKKS